MIRMQGCPVLLLAVFCAIAQADSLSIVAYGATPNDATNDNAAIVAAIAAAASQHKDVYIPAGTFIHQKFTISGVTVRGSGDASILHAPDSKNAQITLSGRNSGISDLKSTVVTQARDPLWCDNIRAENADTFLIQNVTVDGADGAGLMTYVSSNGRIIGNRVSNSLSDGIHTTGGSRNIIVAQNTVRHSGDDMIAVVSYGDGAADLVRNVLIQDNDVAGQTWGRGISVVGGMDVTIRRNLITRSSSAGIIIATESSYTTGHVENVLLEDNTVVEPVYVQTTSGHSGVLVSADNMTITRVLFRNTTVTDAYGQGVRIEGGANPNNIGFVNTAINSPGGSAFVISSGTNIYCTGTTLDGAPISPCSGTLNFTVTGSSLSYEATPLAPGRRPAQGRRASPARRGPIERFYGLDGRALPAGILTARSGIALLASRALRSGSPVLTMVRCAR